MISAQMIAQTIEEVPENQLIFASKLYEQRLKDTVSEAAFYQTLIRLCKAGKLCRIAKGTYYRPKVSKYGIVPPSQKEIVDAFTQSNAGTVVGYALYNNLNLTTQIPKTVEVLSSKLEQKTKSISNVQLQACDLEFTTEVKNMVHILEVLQNFNAIQDLDYKQFLQFCETFVQNYNEIVFQQVYQQIRYQKRTISFLRTILNYYHVSNGLHRFLSTLSDYKHPTMEDIYEIAHGLNN